jgi:glyoxylase-like metal-dependent hydrolase (beta-lactamase superfamily II)
MMNELHIFTFGPFSENTYLLDHGDGNATVFDPGMSNVDERTAFSEFCDSNGLKLVSCLLTHSHLDHVMGAGWIYDNYGIAPRLHPKDDSTWQQAPISAQVYGIPMDPLPPRGENLGSHGSIIECGIHKFEVRLAPGHSVGHVVFVCHEQNTVIGGDVLFSGSVGRTDLPGGDAATLAKSIENQIYTLQDNTIVYPGHGPATTVEKEKQGNPFVNGAGTGMMQS